MSKIRRLRLLVLAFLPLIFTACKYDLVKETTFDYSEKKNAADYDDFILPPQNVTASHGQSKSVTLEWIGVKNAVQYQIYSAPTPYDTFTKISETKGDETQIIIDEESGITKYYCVCAVNYYGTVSAKSVVVMGTSLAVPIITEIQADSEGDAVVVEWWMDNCSNLTYQNDVNFYVYTSLKTSPNLKYKTVCVSGDTRKVRIDGLTSKTEYLFEVEVVNGQNENKEVSGKYSAETAHRVLPNPPVEFTVSKGESKSQIVLSWKTPDGAWYRENSGASGFVKHPVYFEVYRKQNDKTEKIKTIRLKLKDEQSFKEDESELVFTDEDKTSCEQLENAPYDKYYVGATISFTDTIENENRGMVYSYYVQSITDDIKDKRITSESSCTNVVEGWTVGVPKFSIKTDYKKDDNTFTSISFKYNLQFDNRGVPYSYFIKKEKLKLDGITQDGEPELLPFTSVEVINFTVEKFNPAPESSQNGYYKYTLFVCPAGTNVSDCENDSSCFYTIPASGKYIVTHDATSIPKIENFKVEDGFKDSYELSWKYNSEYVYIIHWWEIHGNERGNEESLEITPDNGWRDGDTVNYPHPAVSGSRRIYALEASTGISETAKLYEDEETKIEEKIFETLGTAEPSFTTYDYSTITVTWPKVQKADENYEVTASFEDGGVAVGGDVQITAVPNDANTYRCVITNPNGWNDATVSGKKINLTVTAKNDKASTQSQSVAVCTLGPALADTKILGVEESSITVQWNKIEGATGYIITRNSQIADQDIYFFDGNSIAVNGEAVDSNHVIIRENSDGTYKLIDKAVDAIDETNSYTINQACIEWGLPFGYTVIPVKAGSSSNPVAYENLVQKTGAAKGFGLNVHAQKSESSEKQIVEWTKPNIVDKTSSPVLYYRGYNDDGTTENKWKKLSVDFESSNAKTKPFTPPFSPNTKTEAFEYLVAYGRSASELTKVPVSLVQDSKMGGLSTLETEYTYTDVPAEKANKGYLLAVDYQIHTGSNNSERVDWDEWDYSKRSIGPDSAILSICNYNLGNSWTEVASLDKDMHYLSTGTGLINTTVTKQNDTELSLKPTVLMDGTMNNPVTKGHLQVLRDARHYYAITLSRGGASYELGKDNSVYGYRDITDKELVKCALLNVAYALYLDCGGNQDLSNAGSHLIHGKPSQATFIKLSNEDIEGAYHYSYAGSMPDFSQLYITPGGTRTSVMKVSFDNTRLLFKCNAIFTKYYFLKFMSSYDLNVVKYYDDMPDCYSCTLKVTCNGTDDLIVEKDEKEILKVTDNESRRIYFPAQISSDDSKKDEKQCWIKNTTYGWWN